MMCLSLTACGGSTSGTTVVEKESRAPEVTPTPLPLVLGEENQVEDRAEFSLFKITTTRTLEPTMAGGYTYENSSDGEVYVDVIFDYTNQSSQAVSSEDIASLTAAAPDGTTYTDAVYAVETDNSSSLGFYEDINPLTSARIHAALSVPESAGALELRLEVADLVYTYSYQLGAVERNAAELKVGDTLSADGFASVTWKGMEYTDDLLPPNTSGFYQHYAVDSADNTYLVARFDVTNEQSTERDCDTFLSVKAVYLDKYTYTGFVVAEDSDGTGFHRGSLAPLTTTPVYVLIEVPKSVIGNDVELDIAFNRQEYLYTQPAA